MQNVLIHGPRGCGKTTNSELLRDHFGCDTVVELEAGRLPDMKLLANKYGKYARLLFLCTPETLNQITRAGVTEILWKLKIDKIIGFYRAIALASKQHGDDADREDRIEALLYDMESNHGPSAPHVYPFDDRYAWTVSHGGVTCKSHDLYTAILDLSAKILGTFSREEE